MVKNGLHFPVMIIASLLIFYLILWIVSTQKEFRTKQRHISILAMAVVVFGMLFGRYGAKVGLSWWVYYPVPMLITVVLPPLILKLNFRRTSYYLLLSFLSAPFIHFIFSFFIGWPEYMPFWDIPFAGTFFS